MKLKTLVLGLIFSVALSPSAFAKPKSLYERFEGKNVKAFVAPVTDVTTEKAVDPTALHAQITSALQARKGIHFTVVPTEAEAEVSIRTEISDFEWTNSDPIDMLMGVGGAAMDAAVVEDYARLQANVTVTDNAKQKDLWKERVMATITKKPMSQAESIPLVSENFAKAFLKNAFNRPKH